jgi:hypothetical protein
VRGLSLFSQSLSKELASLALPPAGWAMAMTAFKKPVLTGDGLCTRRDCSLERSSGRTGYRGCIKVT